MDVVRSSRNPDVFWRWRLLDLLMGQCEMWKRKESRATLVPLAEMGTTVGGRVISNRFGSTGINSSVLDMIHL